MPVASEPGLPRTWRPLGVRIAGIVFGGALLAVCVAAWFSFDADVRARFTPFQRTTLGGIGLLLAAAGYALARSRVVADAEHLVVVNGYVRHEYDWAEVIAVHLAPGAPWAVLDLADGTSQSAMGIQGSDGARAQAAVRELREVIDGFSG